MIKTSLALSLLTGTLAGFVSQPPPTTLALDSVQRADASHSLCAGGPSELGLHLHLDTTSTGELELTALNELEDPLKIRFVLEIVNDVGEEMLPAEFSIAVDLASKQEKALRQVEVPTWLPNGYYQVRVTAAGTTRAGAETSTIVEVYYRVDAGSINKIDLATFTAESEDNAAIVDFGEEEGLQ